jgi:hypothetical protein
MCCPVYLYLHVYKKLTFWIPQACSTWQVVLSYARNSASHDSASQNQPAITPLARIQLASISHKRSQLMRKPFMHLFSMDSKGRETVKLQRELLRDPISHSAASIPEVDLSGTKAESVFKVE